MTAIEWLKQQYIERGETLPSGVFQEALEMERKLIIKAFANGHHEGWRVREEYNNNPNTTGMIDEDYYNKNYKIEDSE